MKALIRSLIIVLCSCGVAIANPWMDNPIQIDSIVQEQETCDLSNGSLTIYVSGGNVGVEYSIDNGDNWQDSPHFPGLPDNDYLVVVRDMVFCSETFTAQISDAPDPEVDLQVDCVAGRNLSNIVPTVTYGTPSYNYNWEGNGISSTDDILTNVPPGLYRVTVTDRLGCMITDSIRVEPCCELFVECAMLPIDVNCETDVPEINPALSDAATTEEDLILILQTEGITVDENSCEGIMVQVNEAQNSPLDCNDGPLIITRTYTVFDDYFSFECQQEIRVTNAVAPIIAGQGQSLRLDCSDEIEVKFQEWLANNADVVIEGCSEPYTFTTIPENPTPPTSCDDVVDVTFTVIDACGNELSSNASFSYFDNEGPILDCPGAIQVDPADPQLETIISDWLSTATASDLCNSTTDITNNYQPGSLDVDCDQSLTIEILFEVEDLCGNNTPCVSPIEISGLSAPTIDCGNDLILNCNDDMVALADAWISDFSAVDGDGLPLSLDNDLDPADLASLVCNEELYVTFSTKDDCDRPVECIRTISVIDDENPEITCPTTLTISIADIDVQSTIDAWLDSHIALDNCDLDPMVTNDFSGLPDLCADSDNLEVNFEVVDACGNENSCLGNIEIQGLSLPSLDCPDDLRISCDEDRVASVNDWLADFSAVDGNGLPLVVDNDLVSGSVDALPCNEELFVTFSTKDDCDRPLDCIRTISVIDDESPELDCPPNLEINATDTDLDNTINAWLDTYSALDNCDQNLNVTNDFSSLPDLCESGDDIIVNYAVEDLCGNAASCSTTIIVKHASPGITCPQNLNMECGEDTDALVGQWLESVTASENDGNLITNDIGDLSQLNGCMDEMTVNFSTENDCGQGATCFAVLSISDTQAPQITCPNNQSINILDGNLDASVETWLSMASATDCSLDDLSNDYDSSLENVICDESILVTFTALDACGQTSTCQSNIDFYNDGTISIECPEPLSLGCTLPNLEQLVEDHLTSSTVTSDNDYELFPEFNFEELEIDCEDLYNFEIQVIAIDACGTEVECRTSVEILPEPKIYIPNVISPDGDGVNDYFNVFGNESVDYVASMLIFNRWGAKIFEAYDITLNDEQAGWNGHYNQTEERSQVFTYMVDVMDATGNIISKVGTVQVLK